jgi:hypothetical protein
MLHKSTCERFIRGSCYLLLSKGIHRIQQNKQARPLISGSSILQILHPSRQIPIFIPNNIGQKKIHHAIPRETCS